MRGRGVGCRLSAVPFRRLVFTSISSNASCTEILRCAQNDEREAERQARNVCREAALKLAPVRAPYLASATILYNYPGRKPRRRHQPSRRKTTVGRLNGRPFYGQAKGQLRPTCTSYAGCAHQPSGIQVSTAIASPSFQYFKLRLAAFFRRRHFESCVDPLFQFRHMGDDAHQAAGILEVD